MLDLWKKYAPRRRRRLWPSEPDPRRPKRFYEFDADFHRRYETAMAATETRVDRPLRRLRFFTLERAAFQVRNVPGNACEVGCFRGMSAYIAAAAFKECGKTLDFHICDSFEGLSEPTAEDNARGNEPPVKIRPHAYACSEADVRRHLAPFDMFRFHKGWIPEPFKTLTNERFCYAYIDVDLAEPTRDALEFLWPRLNPGGVIVLDDYGALSYPGSRRAIDGFFAGRRDVFLVDCPAGNGLAIKVAP
jgi:hypothetical protein